MQEISPKKCVCLHKWTVFGVIYWSSRVSANVISGELVVTKAESEVRYISFFFIFFLKKKKKSSTFA